jgi:amino acid permease
MWDTPALSLPSEPQVDVTKSPMLRMYPGTFVPLRHRAMSIAEVAFLIPSSNSSRRQATVVSAIFNMTATIIGGGVLSIPLSCARAGLIPFTILMIASAFMTDFSLYVLCSCARRTGSTSYGRVAGTAIGESLEMFATAVIFFLVGCILVGLMVLNQGIWSPIFVALLDHVTSSGDEEPSSNGITTTSFEDAIVLLVLLAAMFRFLLAKDLTSLRHICFVGFFSIAILCVTMVFRAAEKNINNPQEIKWAADNMADVLNALPIILLAFLCSFNIIGVHCALVEPTQKRVQDVIHGSVFMSFLLMYVFGVAGYFWAFEETNGNILLNFDPADSVIFFGRIGCGITTLFALPMNLLPCREALLSLIAQIGEVRFRKQMLREEQKSLLDRRAQDHDKNEPDGDDPESHTTITTKDGFKLSLPKNYSMPPSKKGNEKDENGNGFVSYQNSALPGSAQLRKIVSHATNKKNASYKEPEVLIHWVSTLGIVLVCYIFAVLAPGVAIVWDIAGSSMAFLIQFIIPAACYIRLKQAAEPGILTWHLAEAWILVVVSSIGAVLCTTVVISRLL